MKKFIVLLIISLIPIEFISSQNVSKNGEYIGKESCFIICVNATQNKDNAIDNVQKLKLQGYSAGFLWIPNYKSLSGVQYYEVFIGPFKTQVECEMETEKYRKLNPNAYGLLVSQDNKRVEIRGINKIKVTNPYRTEETKINISNTSIPDNPNFENALHLIPNIEEEVGYFWYSKYKVNFMYILTHNWQGKYVYVWLRESYPRSRKENSMSTEYIGMTIYEDNEGYFYTILGNYIISTTKPNNEVPLKDYIYLIQKDNLKLNSTRFGKVYNFIKARGMTNVEKLTLDREGANTTYDRPKIWYLYCEQGDKKALAYYYDRGYQENSIFWDQFPDSMIEKFKNKFGTSPQKQAIPDFNFRCAVLFSYEY